MAKCRKLSETSFYKTMTLDEDDENESNDDKLWRGWRYLPTVDADVMIISSYGDEYPSDVKVAKKLVPQDSTTDRLVLAQVELDCLQDLYEQINNRHIYCYSDHGGVQWSKDYYLERMEKFLQETDKECVYFFFTGDSEVSTGNWCFKDGVIAFQDIYNLYIKHFSGKRLSIVSDCSYSGNWVRECAKVYDEQGILACGHHSRERGLLIVVSASCKACQEATILAYVNEAMEVKLKDVIFWSDKTLSSGQTVADGHFTMIRCRNKPDKKCEYTRSNQTWENMMLIGQRVAVITGVDEEVEIWHCVLVDDDKMPRLRAQAVRGNIDVTDYGVILHSGWGRIN